MFKLACIAVTALLATSVARAAPQQAACQMSPDERKWVEKAFGAWEFVRTKKLRLADPYRPTIILFDARCRYETPPNGALRWTGVAHGGEVRFPDGESMPPAVTSFASVDEKKKQAYFVMALPSIWRGAKIHPGHRSLDDLLTFVFLHEYTHTRQGHAVSAYFESLPQRFKLPEDTNDDSLQKHFQKDPAYVAAFERERDLLYAAAAEPDPAKARLIAAEALQAMRARQARWFTGAEAIWKPVDDMFLTMEAVGQWAGYSWLIDKRGRGLDPATALNEARSGKKWWSQDEGLALLLVIDRFLPGWQAKVFARKPAVAIDLLGEALGERAATR